MTDKFRWSVFIGIVAIIALVSSSLCVYHTIQHEERIEELESIKIKQEVVINIPSNETFMYFLQESGYQLNCVKYEQIEVTKCKSTREDNTTEIRDCEDRTYLCGRSMIYISYCDYISREPFLTEVNGDCIEWNLVKQPKYMDYWYY